MNIAGRPCNSGVEVVGINADGPAASAGVKRGDIIVSIAGTKTETVDDLHRTLSDHGVGEPIDLVILRGQERIILNCYPGRSGAIAESIPRVRQKKRLSILDSLFYEFSNCYSMFFRLMGFGAMRR